MSEEQAKKQLREMLRSLTAGSILHLLAEAVREYAEDDIQVDDERLDEQVRTVEAALFVVGLGVDAALPR